MSQKMFKENKKLLEDRMAAWLVCWLVGHSLPDQSFQKQFTCYICELAKIKLFRALWPSRSESQNIRFIHANQV